MVVSQIRGKFPPPHTWYGLYNLCDVEMENSVVNDRVDVIFVSVDLVCNVAMNAQSNGKGIGDD